MVSLEFRQLVVCARLATDGRVERNDLDVPVVALNAQTSRMRSGR